MSKFYGNIGFVKVEETSDDVYESFETVVPYVGDITRNQRRWTNGESVNENLEVSNEISIVLDDFLQENMGFLKWVEFLGSKWKVNSITLKYPRIVLTLGGVYNGG